MDDAAIGRRVREARGSMSQEELAETMAARAVAWRQTTVHAVETGKRPLRFAEAVVLSDELGVSLDSLAGRPSVTEDALRTWARESDDRLRRAWLALGELIHERDPLRRPWEV